jgi:hypothetical protein
MSVKYIWVPSGLKQMLLEMWTAAMVRESVGRVQPVHRGNGLLIGGLIHAAPDKSA